MVGFLGDGLAKGFDGGLGVAEAIAGEALVKVGGGEVGFEFD